MRLALAGLAGLAVACLGALILGEYELAGSTPYVAGVLFGLVVAEAVVTVARRGGAGLAVFAGLASAAGMVWAAWIAAGRDWHYVAGGAWAGVAVGAAVAGARTARARPTVRSTAPPTGDSSPAP